MTDTKRRVLTLEKAWDGLKKGKQIQVLLPHEDPAPGFVDALRADALVRDGYASEISSAPPATSAEGKES